MAENSEIAQFLTRHLGTIFQNDIEGYHNTTSADLSLYEWWVTPHRIDGLSFHDFMMEQNARMGTAFGAEKDASSSAPIRFDLANLKIQEFENTAVASYTLLISTGTSDGVVTSAHNESRVMIRKGESWKVVHVHKSPAWQAPHTEP